MAMPCRRDFSRCDRATLGSYTSVRHEAGTPWKHLRIRFPRSTNPSLFNQRPRDDFARGQGTKCTRSEGPCQADRAARRTASRPRFRPPPPRAPTRARPRCFRKGRVFYSSRNRESTPSPRPAPRARADSSGTLVRRRTTRPAAGLQPGATRVHPGSTRVERDMRTRHANATCEHGMRARAAPRGSARLRAVPPRPAPP